MGSCYSVTITCIDGENNCSYVGTVGENCACIVGAPCDDGNPCTAGGYFDENCNCIEYTLTDSDGDGICDIEDECPGFDDNEDIDNDGIPDGCDVVECDSLQVKVEIDTIYPGSCTYTINIDSMLAGTDYVNIYQFTVGNEIVNSGYNLPICFGPQGVTLEVANDDFENGWGFWGGFPPDANRINDQDYATSGQYSLRLRDDSEFSQIKSQVFSVNGFSSVSITFNIKSKEFENGDKFILEASYDAGLNYQFVREWNYGTHFQNDNFHSFSAVNIPTNGNSHIKLRFRNLAHGDNRKVHFDDIVIVKNQDDCSIEHSLDLLVEGITQWLLDNNKSGTVSHSNNYNADTCDAPGHTIIITDANVSFESMTGQNINSIVQREFCTFECQGSMSNDTLIEYSIITNCGDPDILWSDGSVADSILIPINSNILYTFTLSCGTCDTTITVNEPECVVGGLCTPAVWDPCFGYYLFDANCNCIGYAPITADNDNDGIPDCEDPCLNCPENDSNGNGICDCLEPCPPIDSLQFIYKPVEKENCDLCTKISNMNDLLFTGFVLVYPDSIVEVTSLPFDFPYCTKYAGYECMNGLPTLNSFASTFYYWSLSRGEHPVIMVNDSSCYNVPALRISNVPYTEVRLLFNNGGFNMERINCSLDTLGYDITVAPINNCEDPQYEWSNGSTADTIFVPSVNTGFYVSITCKNGCVYSDSTNNTDCYYGAPCTDADPCTLGDTYDYNCNCVGNIIVEDSDNDGVCDSIDICNGFNDYLDYDGDGIPNGCDSCFVDTIRVCDFCVDLKIPNCTSVKEINYVDQNNVPGVISFSSIIGIGPNCNAGNNQFIFELTNWLISHQHTGTPSFSLTTCSGKNGFSLRITQSDLRFINIIFAGATQPFLFKESNCQWKFKSIAGLPCNDRDTCTIRDAFDINCNCVGEFVDSDRDGVCDPLDQCPEFPDYMDNNNNGKPDMCEEFYFYCSETDSLLFCDYFKKIVVCSEKFQPVDLIRLQDTLRVWLESESTTSIVKANFPGLLEQLNNIPSFDPDGDGIIYLFDICPDDPNYPDLGSSLFTLNAFSNCTCDKNVSSLKASLIASFFFQPGTSILKDENGNVIYEPPCPGEVGLQENEEGFLVFQNNPECYGTVEIDCDCKCKAVILSDADKDGICDNIDTMIGKQCTLECPDTSICVVCRVVGNPDYHPTDNPTASPCMLEYTNLADSDDDGVCDINDDCPGEDDLEDTDGDTIPDCLDLCPDSTFVAFALSGTDPPSGPGDPCDDHDPCTYADSISFDCKCEGIRLDLDGDSIFDCGPCVIMHDSDGDGLFDTPVDLFSNFVPCDSCYFVDCDVCPGIDDGGDYNGNGVPDCLDPPYYPVGCPGDFSIVPNEGLLLIFDSDEIRLEDIPEPVSFTIMSQGSSTSVNKYDYLTVSYIREVNGTFEVLYGGNIAGSLDPLFASVSYADHQNCILSDSVDNLVDIICPTGIDFVNDQLVLIVDYAGINGLPDISKFEGQYILNLTSSASQDSSLEFTANLGTIYTPQQSGTYFELSMGAVVANVSNFANYMGTITLPNGTVCTYENGVQEACTSGVSGKPGDPCDDNNQCTHHDRIQMIGGICECKGDPDPDIDGDDICDKIDPCPDVPNTAADGPDPDNLPDCPCPTLTVQGDSLTGLNDYNVGINMTGGGNLNTIIVTISGGPDGDYNDTLGTTMPLVVPNLPKGYPLTLTFVGQGSTGCVTDPLVVEVDVPFETDPVLCGSSAPSSDIVSNNGTEFLVKGDQFKAADFMIEVEKATGGNGRFTGNGFVVIPYFKQARVNVKFENIFINDRLKLTSGHVLLTGLGLKIIPDDVDNILTDVLGVLDDVSSTLDDIIDVVETVEQVLNELIKYLPEATQECLKQKKILLDAAIQSGNQAAINQAKQEYKDCLTEAKDELGDLLFAFNDIINLSLNALSVQYTPILNDPQIQLNYNTTKTVIDNDLQQLEVPASGNGEADSLYFTNFISSSEIAGNVPTTLETNFKNFNVASLNYFKATALATLNSEIVGNNDERQKFVDVIKFIGMNLVDFVGPMLKEGVKTQQEMVDLTKYEIDKYFSYLYVYLNSK